MTAGIAIPSSSGAKDASPPPALTVAQQVLLAGGIVSTLLYTAMLVIVPMFWEGYSSASQSVSELSAIDAPTRSLWVSLGVAWAVLYGAFGCGVWLSARSNRALRVAGAVIIVAAIAGLFWPPMHQREVLAAGGKTLTDTLHLVWTAVNGILTLLAMGIGGAALGGRFRLYSVATMAILLAAGALTSVDAPRIDASLPTPWMGVWERVNIGAWLLWVVVLAVTLLRRPMPRDGHNMSTIEAVIKRHSVLTYFALVFMISWGGAFLVLGPGGFPPSAEEFENLGALFYIAILAGPCLSGILLTGIVDGRPGLRELLARLRRWRAGSRWYALALLPALVMTATALLLSLVSSDFRPAILDSNDRAGIVMRALGPALLVGCFEEIGWTGFAVPHLRSRHSILTSGLAVGVVWGAWHFPLFWEGDSFSATLPFAALLTRLFSWLPPFRVLLAWLHDRTQSLPVVMFMHALVSFVAITLSHETLTGARLLTSLLMSAVTMWLLLAAVGAANRWRLSRQPARRVSTS